MRRYGAGEQKKQLLAVGREIKSVISTDGMVKELEKIIHFMVKSAFRKIKREASKKIIKASFENETVWNKESKLS
jgi:hypothetical protein